MKRLATVPRGLMAVMTALVVLLVGTGATAALAAPNYSYDGHKQLSRSIQRAPLGARGSLGGIGRPKLRDATEALLPAPTGFVEEAAVDTATAAAEAGDGAAVRILERAGECPVICATVGREAAEHGFSTAGLPAVDDGTSAILRSQVAAQLRGFGAAAQGLEGDAIIGATALERGIPLISGDWDLYNSVIKLGGEARWFAPGA